MTRIIVALFLALIVRSVDASTVTTAWNVNLRSQHDYVLGHTVPITVPSSFDVTITYPNLIDHSIDHGTTTITYFGWVGDTQIDSPLVAFVGSNPYGPDVTGNEAYTFPNVSDYESTFIEQFAAQGSEYSPSGPDFWTYYVGMHARRDTPSQGGTGNADYAFSPSSLLNFLSDVQENPSNYQISFTEYWQIYDGDTDIYLDGQLWDGQATLVSVSIPIPASAWLFGSALGLLGWMRKTKQ